MREITGIQFDRAIGVWWFDVRNGNHWSFVESQDRAVVERKHREFSHDLLAGNVS
jgi:hypothetical protein